MHYNHLTRGLLSALMLATTYPVMSTAGEIKLKQKDVPAQIMTEFHKAFPNAKATGFSKETEEGKTFYEIESLDGNVRRDILYFPDGKLESVEEVIPVSTLPAAVSTSVAKEYPGAKIEKCEKIMKGGATTYECVVADSKHRMEVVFSSEGKIEKKEMLKGKGK